MLVSDLVIHHICYQWRRFESFGVSKNEGKSTKREGKIDIISYMFLTSLVWHQQINSWMYFSFSLLV